MFTRRIIELARAECAHSNNVTVCNSGIERTVCENCGHVSFRARKGLSGTADRRMFERQVESERTSAG